MAKGSRFSILIIAYNLLLAGNGFAQATQPEPIRFLQDGKYYSTTKSMDSVTLEKKPFSIIFFGRQATAKKSYAMQIAALEHAADTSLIKIGQPTAGVPYLEPGSGLAGGPYGYDELFIDNAGHHYIYYDNEKDRRVKLLSKNKDRMEFEWHISAAFYEGEDVAFTALKQSEVYLVFFADDDLNEIVDRNELKIIKLKFK